MYGITTQKWNKKNVITIMVEEIFKLPNELKKEN